ncbi:hypothetical protein [Streptomyces sp. JHA26]|uniref:hypothetical protein n=1 Tax=Streptomyces sp. JHA26 TaxID=1917143 RepID=UPI00098AAE5C|nr:hypothetical protein [Streptomyces sp. JHA26]
MTGGRARRPDPDVAAAIGAEAEGFLLARSHWTEAHREARALCDRLPWLTTAQAEDLTHHYVDGRIALSRRMLAATVRRAEELREEYEARYLELRRRLLVRHAAWASATLACSAGVGSTLCTLFR